MARKEDDAKSFHESLMIGYSSLYYISGPHCLSIWNAKYYEKKDVSAYICITVSICCAAKIDRTL